MTTNTMSGLKTMFLSILCCTVLLSYLAWSSVSTEDLIAFHNPQELTYICTESFKDTRTNVRVVDGLPIIYFITPTYPRREQFPELVRLGQTLMHVPNLHWIVADDSKECNTRLSDLFSRLGMPFTYLASPMPNVYRKKHFIPRGVSNRRASLNWIKANVKNGVFYFGDDDNTFDLRLFDEIRYTKKVSMFPVGLIGDFGVSSPILKQGHIAGFFDSWPADRQFPVDMAGFAVSVEFLLQNPNATMPYKAGHEEDLFLKSLQLKLEDIEPKAKYCTEIYVWHTQTVKKPLHKLKVYTVHDITLKALLEETASLGITRHNYISGQDIYLSIDGKKRLITKDGKL